MEDTVKEYGTVENNGILVMSVIGEIEGHDNLGKDGKTTKYEHILPILAKAENNPEVKGILFLVNTVGGDEDSYSFINSWRQPFHRCSYCCGNRLFIHCSYRYNGNSSGKNEWNSAWSKTDIQTVSEHAGQNNRFYRKKQ